MDNNLAVKTSYVRGQLFVDIENGEHGQFFDYDEVNGRKKFYLYSEGQTIKFKSKRAAVDFAIDTYASALDELMRNPPPPSRNKNWNWGMG